MHTLYNNIYGKIDTKLIPLVYQILEWLLVLYRLSERTRTYHSRKFIKTKKNQTGKLHYIIHS